VRHDLFDVLGMLRDRTGVTIFMTTHYLDEAERLCDRVAIIDAGRIVACNTPANLLATVGTDVLDVRVDDPNGAVAALEVYGVDRDDVLVIGTTVTVPLRTFGSEQLVRRLQDSGFAVRSVTTRRPTLDDVYLRLTGDRLGGSD
jgi:ABC-2 type transport system ATP-binding protein